MNKSWMACGLALLALVVTPGRAADLSSTEAAWLQAAMPVLIHARDQGLPLDIIVQPQPTPGETPLGMAYQNGRCQLVLSMRGNPEAQATLDRVAPGLRGPVIESIAAHELAHCWRHVRKLWGTLPAGLQEAPGFERLSTEHAALLKEMWRTRREEGFADLVGLAWTLKFHPDRYAEVHAWHVELRAQQAVDTGPHDTRAWIRLAGDKSQFTPGGSIFEQVQKLWRAGLVAAD